MDHKPRVLFFAVGDSTRSQMAEGFLRSLAGDRFIGVSSATQTVWADPLASDVMNEVGIDISEQHSRAAAESSKSTSPALSALAMPQRRSFPLAVCPQHIPLEPG